MGFIQVILRLKLVQMHFMNVHQGFQFSTNEYYIYMQSYWLINVVLNLREAVETKLLNGNDMEFVLCFFHVKYVQMQLMMMWHYFITIYLVRNMYKCNQ